MSIAPDKSAGAPSTLRELQYGFAGHIRDPRAHPAPADVHERVGSPQVDGHVGRQHAEQMGDHV